MDPRYKGQVHFECYNQSGSLQNELNLIVYEASERDVIKEKLIRFKIIWTGWTGLCDSHAQDAS